MELGIEEVQITLDQNSLLLMYFAFQVGQRNSGKKFSPEEIAKLTISFMKEGAK